MNQPTRDPDSQQRLAELLAVYSAVPAPPGHEESLGEVVAGTWPASEVARDRLGNLWFTIGSGDEHVLVLAHLDEVALVVRRIESDGFLRVHRVGGIPERVLMGQGALVLGAGAEPVYGVFGTVAHHLASDAQRTRVVPAGEQYLDVGAGSADDARDRLGIAVGDFVVYERTFRRDGPSVWANAVDDRAGLAVLTEVADRLVADAPDRRVTILASVQEEFSLRGLLPAVRTIAPDLILSLDISPACDTPDLRDGSEVHLGGGPVVNHYSFHGRGTLAGVIPPRWLTDEVERLGDDAGIPYQRGALLGGLTDASFAQLEGEGAPALEIGIPCRYTHAPVERADLRDLSWTCDLVEQIVREVSVPPPRGVFVPSVEGTT
jgi:putative aminopeptidase